MINTDFRKASADDAEALSQLAFYSEAHLGYDSDYMKKFSELYNITADFINKNIVYILAMESRYIGFWGLIKTGAGCELEFFFIDSSYIGKGYGSKMWKHLIERCNDMGIFEFHFVTSHQSVPFYEKMGATVIRHVESLIMVGRMIPKLRYVV